jgi:hypothetical protein
MIRSPNRCDSSPPEALASNLENARQLLRSYCTNTRKPFSLIGKNRPPAQIKRFVWQYFPGIIPELVPENVYSFDFPLSRSALVWRSPD